VWARLFLGSCARGSARPASRPSTPVAVTSAIVAGCSGDKSAGSGGDGAGAPDPNTSCPDDGDNSGAPLAVAFAAPVFYPIDAEPARAVAGDFNEDGNVDIAIAEGLKADAVLVLPGDGTGAFGEAKPLRAFRMAGSTARSVISTRTGWTTSSSAEWWSQTTPRSSRFILEARPFLRMWSRSWRHASCFRLARSPSATSMVTARLTSLPFRAPAWSSRSTAALAHLLAPWPLEKATALVKPSMGWLARLEWARARPRPAHRSGISRRAPVSVDGDAQVRLGRGNCGGVVACVVHAHRRPPIRMSSAPPWAVLNP